MTESEFDALLRRALIDVIHEDYADILEGEPDVPPHPEKYLRRERKLLADPLGYVRRLARPVWKKALRMAACILLALATLFGSVMALSPSARAWVVDRVIRWTQTYAEFSFITQDNEVITADWRPNYVPLGFEEVDATWSETSHTLRLTYENLGGETIRIICKPYAQGNIFNVDNEHSNYQQIEVNGRPADLFSSNTDGFPNYVLWTSSGGGIAYMIVSDIDTDKLISIACGKK